MLPPRLRTSEGPHSERTARTSRRLRATLLASLGFPWFVHAAVVCLSALGAKPLAGRAVALAMLLLALAFAAALFRWQFRRDDAHEAEQEDAPLERADLPMSAKLPIAALTAAAAAALVVVAVLSMAAPVSAYDALSYRLPVIAQWLDTGRVAWVTSDDAVRNGYPLGQEAVSAVVAAATGSMGFAGTTSLLFVLAGALSIWVLAEESGVRRDLAAGAAAVFVLVPVTLLNAPSGYVDAAFAGATVALLCLSALFSGSERQHDREAWAVGLGFCAAHVLALKGTGLAFVGIACLGVLVRIQVGVRLRLRAPIGATSGLVALLLAAPGAFWAWRNVIHTGNPLWPIEIGWGGRTWLQGTDTMDRILDVLHNTPPEWLHLSEIERTVRAWLQLAGPADSFDDRFAGLGYSWPLFALPALVGRLRGFRGAPPPRLTELGFVVLLSAACFLVQPMRWWPRYTLWLWGAGALAMASVAEQLARAGHRQLLAAGLSALVLVSVAEASRSLSRIKSGHRSRSLSQAFAAIPPEFWRTQVEGRADVCRTSWHPESDDTLLDGVWAQVTPRPHVHILRDEDADWPRLRRDWLATGCQDLLLLRGSPVLDAASRDPSVSVEVGRAFDPLFIVHPQKTLAASRAEDPHP